MISLSGLDIATGRNSCFKLSGSFCRPPYFFPAGFMVTKIPEFGSRGTSRSIKVTVLALFLRAVWK